MKLRLLLTTLLAAGLAVLGFGQVTKTPNGYLFRYKFVKGRQYNYIITSSIASPGEVKVDGPFVETITGVKGTSGKISIVLGPLSSGGKQAVAKVSRSFTETNVGGVADASVQQMFTQYPIKAIKPGDTWTGQTSAAAMGSQTMVTAKYKFEKMTTVNGHAAAQIAMTMTTTGQAIASGGGTLLILADDGSLYSTHTTLVMSGKNAPGKALHIKMAMVRR